MHCISFLTSAGRLKIGRLIFGSACNQQFQLKFVKKGIFVRGVLSGLFRKPLQVYAALGAMKRSICNVFELACM